MPDPAGVVWSKRLNPYSMELRFQLLVAKAAFESLESHIKTRQELGREFNRANRENPPPPLELEQKEFYARYLTPITNLTGPILGDIQGFLAAGGVIASILWPSAHRFHNESKGAVTSRLARGAEIRELLGVTEGSILNSRTGGDDDVRGGFLHFDEMIDEFKRIHPGEDFVSFDIGSGSSGTSVRRSSAVRWLDEDTLELYVNGRHGNLRDLWNEIYRVLGRIQISSTVQLFVGGRREAGPPAPGLAFGTSAEP